MVGERLHNDLRGGSGDAVGMLQDAQEAVLCVEVASQVGKVDENGGGEVI